MMKIFNFYLGILVRTRVYTNTDRMDLRVCVLIFSNNLFIYYSLYILITTLLPPIPTSQDPSPTPPPADVR